MQLIKLYTKFAPFYDELNAKVDRNKEVKFIKWLVKKYKNTDGNTLLDAACGTGLYIPYLRGQFRITGMDASKDMLKVARKNNRGIGFVQSNMQRFRTNKKYDVVLCRGAMDYNFNYRELGSTLMNFYRSIKEGGVVIFTFEAVKDTFEEGNLKVRIVYRKNTRLVESAVRHEVPGKTYYQRNVVYLLYNGINPQIFRDFGKEALFPVKKVKELMSKIGFATYIYYDFTKKPYSKSLGKAKAVFVGIKK